MADILLSYTHPDRERIRPLIELLEEEGWDVWWDRDMDPGKKWKPKLLELLATTKIVLVAWSEISIKSKWVEFEADYGLKKNGFVQVILDPVKL